MKKKDDNDPFNPAFKSLKTMVKRPENAGKKVPVKRPEPVKIIPDDKTSFREAMSGVIPLSKNGRERIAGQEGKNIRPSHSPPNEEQEVIAHLRDLVDGSIEMDITFSDEYIEGSISGVARNIMKRLKKGEIPVQDYLDLHGLKQKDAETRVREFLVRSHGRGLQCVLIVHGRGLNSPDSIPVLKERLPVWLNRGPARKIVIAFASARPYDGGTGAIYVLLRRRKANVNK
ncbi:MAG TPA: Smr/MutS family protein [Desulfatiglandales bacterium]|nr:Smr/MutS family protein [Desulfatiglandales bacterium]